MNDIDVPAEEGGDFELEGSVIEQRAGLLEPDHQLQLLGRLLEGLGCPARYARVVGAVSRGGAQNIVSPIPERLV